MIEDRRVRRQGNKAKSTPSTASDVQVSGAGGGSDRAPFGGGPSAPIDAEHDEAAKRLRISEMNAKTIANDLQAAKNKAELAAILAGRSPPLPTTVGKGATSGATTGPVVTGRGAYNKVSAWKSMLFKRIGGT